MVVAEVLESLQVACACSMGGPCQKIVIEVMEDMDAPTNVCGNPVKHLSELSKYEGGKASPKKGAGGRRMPRVAHERPICRPHRA